MYSKKFPWDELLYSNLIFIGRGKEVDGNILRNDNYQVCTH